MAKASNAAVATPPLWVEEIPFKSESAYLCMIVNRRVGIIRVIDFRAGALPAKRLFIQNVAKREGIEKVILLVEKDEVSSWTRVGFVREGQIPGFYKRSDGHLVGCVIGDRTASIEVGEEGQRVAERTINLAKKNGPNVPERTPGVAIAECDEADALKARDDLWKKGRGLSGFDAFGREAERFYIEVTPRKGKANILSAEHQDCFGHSLVEMLRLPENDSEAAATCAGLRNRCETLKERGIVSAFAFAPSDDVMLTGIYLSAGFRKTGLLASGVPALSGNGRKDAILWTRKLANPAGDEEE
jgi:hypothetical protein